MEEEPDALDCEWTGLSRFDNNDLLLHGNSTAEDEDEMGYLERAAWRGQRNNAKDRGIEFSFTYEEWIAWWEAELGSDWFRKRGCKKGQFVMARHLDKGAYTPGNVKCVLQNSNHIEANARSRPSVAPRRQLTVDEVKLIYLEQEQCGILSRRFRVAKVVIERIKRRQVYASVTSGLGAPGRVVHWRMSQRQQRLDGLKRRLGRDDIWIRRL